jgi:uncharacterized OB-fold protein
MKPPQYWRQNKEWKKWIGKKGTVLASTIVRVSAPEQSAFTPYSYVLVDFGNEKREFMGVGHQTFEIGDTVECVLRKIAVLADHELIPYGVKVQKI